MVVLASIAHTIDHTTGEPPRRFNTSSTMQLLICRMAPLGPQKLQRGLILKAHYVFSHTQCRRSS